jgi:hypothetical protein
MDRAARNAPNDLGRVEDATKSGTRRNGRPQHPIGCSLFDVWDTRRTPSDLPIAIGMDKTAIANIQQSLQSLNGLGDYTARLVGLELALQLNEDLIGAF